MRMTPKELYEISRDRTYSIEARVSVMFVAVSIITSFLGIILCILVHAEVYSTIAVMGLSMLTLAVLFVSSPRDEFKKVRNVLLFSTFVAMPLIFIGAGGMNSGTPAWLIYYLVYITLACKGTMLYVLLAASLTCDTLLFILDVKGWQGVHHLTQSEKFISITGSCWIVALSIIVTIVVYKRMYLAEQAALEEKTKQLELTNDFERNFLATMSHELRTPINAITGFNELILSESTEADVISYAKDVKNSSDFLLALINDILDYSKIEAGKMSFIKDTYSIENLISRCHDTVARRVEEKGLKLIIKASPDLPTMLYGDENRIFQIIINLLSNAIKYTDEGAITFTIAPEDPDKEFDENGDRLIKICFMVSDTGIGIEKKYLDSIFTSFNRINTIQNKQIEGTGLGLAIVKNLTELMSGTVEVESSIGVGSKFIVTIQQQIVMDEPLGFVSFTNKTKKPDYILPDEPVQERRTSKVYCNVNEEKPAILAVDDTDTNLRVLKLLLKGEDYRIVTVNNGFDAVDFALNNDYALILMDIMMPKLSGVDAMLRIRKEKPDQVIVALTADAVAGAREEYIEKGFNDYLTKPLNSDKLKRTIAKYLGE